ncbi:GTPase Era [candidate division WOR-3 bacterium]|uniref:GTPase Era n=1 Tax=candidate division WOR-3 bacterium TaxID=2052148 RepID=A0A660SP92_UNCW3|nr:MAG: GTPase Era [candidate division WOR-3 bacterium]
MKAGYVTIIGLPNVGKSTLMNRILGQKISIVSKKPQTTRHRIIGILTEKDHQAIFVDTPGLIEPRYQLQEIMVRAIDKALKGTDLVLWMVPATRMPAEPEVKISQRLDPFPTIIAINKIDLVKKDQLLPIMDFFKKLGKEDIYPISALYGEGVGELKESILKSLPEGEFYYPEDMITEHPERFFIAEIIREKIFDLYEEEIPYSTTVTVEEFKERGKEKHYIRAIIYVERRSQKGIIIGKNGQMLKRVGMEARSAIEEFLDHPVYLDLWVKIKEGWRRDLAKIKELGYHP